MKLAIGVILSNGYTAPHEFYFGRAGQDAHPDGEGLYALLQRIHGGTANAQLPPHRQITDVRLIKSSQFPTDVARNEICHGALACGADALLFLDADMVHPATLFESLHRHDVDVVTARYHQKKPPFAAVAYVKHPTQDGPHRYVTVHFGRGLIEIERGGGGALLISRHVLEAIRDRQRHRWDHLLTSPLYRELPAWVRTYLPREPIVQWFRYQQGTKDPFDLSVSEDFWFFYQARDLGFRTYCDWDVECQHIGALAIDRSWNDPFLQKQVGAYTDPNVRDVVLKNTVVLGYRDGMVLDDDTRIPQYAITAGER